MAQQIFDIHLGDTSLSDYEIMAPAGSWESLRAALQAGAAPIYFGIESLNMRAHSAAHFTIDDLHEIARVCSEQNVKTYLTVNTIIYGEDLPLMRSICDAARQAGLSAVIASDVSVLQYCRSIGQEVHLSTQLNISNIEALEFYSNFADVVVLARELNLNQVKEISDEIHRRNILGPGGRLMRIEMFCHGALCMAVSGKCYLSLNNLGFSANRGQCMQLCRRGYVVTDRETGMELEVDNKYIMSPKDLKTIRFLDQMMAAGVRVFKIEGRARGPEYVYTVVRCYKEALQAAIEGRFTEENKNRWDEQLSRVFNRGFWDGYYLGQRLGEWNAVYGSNATEKKVYVGRGVKYFSRLGVAEFVIEAAEINEGDRLCITGPTTGLIYLTADDMRYELQRVSTAQKGWHISIKVPEKVRPSDKLFKLVSVTRN